jgi:hypothetical protein
MVTIDTFHWMPGGHFLMHEGEGTVGDQPIRGLDILGRGAVPRAYISWFFDNGGNHPLCRVTEHDRVWTCTGEFQRAIHTVSEDGKPMKVHWDWSKDGRMAGIVTRCVI